MKRGGGRSVLFYMNVSFLSFLLACFLSLDMPLAWVKLKNKYNKLTAAENGYGCLYICLSRASLELISPPYTTQCRAICCKRSFVYSERGNNRTELFRTGGRGRGSVERRSKK